MYLYLFLKKKIIACAFQGNVKILWLIQIRPSQQQCTCWLFSSSNCSIFNNLSNKTFLWAVSSVNNLPHTNLTSLGLSGYASASASLRWLLWRQTKLYTQQLRLSPMARILSASINSKWKKEWTLFGYKNDWIFRVCLWFISPAWHIVWKRTILRMHPVLGMCYSKHNSENDSDLLILNYDELRLQR